MPRGNYALCVGLNYPGTSAALRGCVNDANDWADALRARRYDVAVVLEPTKQELIANLLGIIERASYGSRIVFTYSGHGTWVPDADGDEPDGRDEALVCSDYRQGGILLDDELLSIFGMRKYGVRAVILSDSCHSGSVSRFAGSASKAGTAVARFMPPGEFLSDEDKARATAVEGVPPRGTPRKGTVLISGCADPEYSYDASFNGRANGAFTYYALQALGKSRHFSEWYRNIRKALPTTQYPQTPQLTAAPHQRYWTAL